MDYNNDPKWGSTPEQSGEWNEQRSYTQMPPQNSNAMGTASMILGIISVVGLCMCLGPITGIIAIALGILQINKTPDNKGASIAGIVTGSIGILLSLIILCIFMFGVKISTDDINQFNIQDFYNQIENYDL